MHIDWGLESLSVLWEADAKATIGITGEGTGVGKACERTRGRKQDWAGRASDCSADLITVTGCGCPGRSLFAVAIMKGLHLEAVS